MQSNTNTASPSAAAAEAQLKYTLQLADDALIIGHRLSEWCGHGPILEQDIALTNTALDHLGRARSLYQYAAELFNKLPSEAKNNFFTSIPMQQLIASGNNIGEDNLASLRDGWDYRNALLLEQPNTDWAYTIARSFFYDAFNYLSFKCLSDSPDAVIAAIAAKSLKEATYHLRWSKEWVIRLGDGTEESHMRMQKAVDDLWMYTGELLAPEKTARQNGVDGSALRQPWLDIITEVFSEANIAMPAGTWMQEGGRDGRHTEHLGYILAELQFMQRAYPGMQW